MWQIGTVPDHGSMLQRRNAKKRLRVIFREPKPIGSMYAIYGDIYHQYTPNVSIYTVPYMDPMGNQFDAPKNPSFLLKIIQPIHETGSARAW